MKWDIAWCDLGSFGLVHIMNWLWEPYDMWLQECITWVQLSDCCARQCKAIDVGQWTKGSLLKPVGYFKKSQLRKWWYVFFRYRLSAKPIFSPPNSVCKTWTEPCSEFLHVQTPMSPRESSHAICLGNAADGTDGGRARCAPIFLFWIRWRFA